MIVSFFWIEYYIYINQLIYLHVDGRDLPSRQPIFVALSRKSRQSTPKLGSKKQCHSSDLHPESIRDLLKSQKIELIQVQEIDDPPISIDCTLYNCS
jgi:hypothetical protein